MSSLLVAGALLSPGSSRVSADAPAMAPGPVTAEHVRGWLDGQGSPPFTQGDRRAAELWRSLRAFYEQRQYEPAWLRDGHLSAGARALLTRAAASWQDGLEPERYDPRGYLGEEPGVLRVSAGEPAMLARLDVAVTYVFVRAASDLARGKVAVVRMPFWRVKDKDVDVVALATEAVESDRPVQVLDRLRPLHPQYAALSAALVRHRAVAERGGWPVLRVAAPLRPGARGAQVVALRKRLALSGDLAAPALADPARFDPALRAAVARFQRRHGIEADGRIGRATLAALNVPAEERIRQIELNLERWRWADWAPGGRSILVNIPTFELHGYDGAREALRMRVITGEGDSPTPVFSETMDTVVFRPHWTVPPNMLATEVLPAVRRDPRYLARNDMEMLRTSSGVVVRQRPGARNSLGLVKFLFPNPFHVYLHDTPGDALFARARRAFSHGCVRVEKPEALADFVLGGAEGWSPARIRQAMQRGGERYVDLPEPIPVVIAYFTVWAEPDGTVRFVPDVYGHDRQQQPMLVAAPASRPVPHGARS